MQMKHSLIRRTLTSETGMCILDVFFPLVQEDTLWKQNSSKRF